MLPGIQIQASRVDFESSVELAVPAAAAAGSRRFELQFRLERGAINQEGRVFRSPLRGVLHLESALTAPRSWTIRSGALDFASLSVESSQSPRGVAPLSARLHVDSGLLSFAAPIVLEGTLELSGTELNSLLKLAGLPESVGYMLSPFQDQPFELTAHVRREATALWLRKLLLSGAGVEMEGALKLSGTVNHGALLVTMGRSTLGVRFGDRGAEVALNANRDWLREQNSASQ